MSIIERIYEGDKMLRVCDRIIQIALMLLMLMFLLTYPAITWKEDIILFIFIAYLIWYLRFRSHQPSPTTYHQVFMAVAFIFMLFKIILVPPFLRAATQPSSPAVIWQAGYLTIQQPLRSLVSTVVLLIFGVTVLKVFAQKFGSKTQSPNPSSAICHLSLAVFITAIVILLISATIQFLQNGFRGSVNLADVFNKQWHIVLLALLYFVIVNNVRIQRQARYLSIRLLGCLVLIVLVGCYRTAAGVYFYQLAMRQFRHCKYDRAVEGLERSLNFNPALQDAYLKLGEINLRSGDREGGFSKFKDAMLIASNAEVAFRLQNEQYEQYLQRGMWNVVAGELLSKGASSRLGLLTFKENFNLGLAFYNLRAYQVATKYLTKALEENPTDAECHYRLGRAYEAMGDTRTALGCYTKAIDLQLNLEAGYFRRGLLYKSKMDFVSAREDFQKVAVLEPESGSVWLQLAQIYQRYGLQNKAQDAYERVVKIYPDFIPAWYQLYRIYQESERTEDAQHVLDEVLELEPRHNIGLKKNDFILLGYSDHFPNDGEMQEFYVLLFWQEKFNSLVKEPTEFTTEQVGPNARIYRVGQRYYGLVYNNLLDNADFEADVTQVGFPSAWSNDIFGAPADCHAVGFIERNSKMTKCTALRVFKGQMYLGCASECIPVNADEVYLQAGWLKSAGGLVHLGRAWYDSKQKEISHSYVASYVRPANWEHYSQIVTPPTGSVYTKIWIESYGNALFDDLVFIKVPLKIQRFYNTPRGIEGEE